MAKRFMYVAIGVLCLVAAYQVGARDARAEWSVGATGSIVGGFSDGSTPTWYAASGEAWQLNVGAGWQRAVEWDLPVPAAEIKFMDDHAFVTVADEGWLLVANSWQNFGSFPGGPVSLDQESWGKVKAKHR